jgi:hypothetical protein
MEGGENKEEGEKKERRLCSSGLRFSGNFHCSDFRCHQIFFMVTLKLAVVAFLLEELNVVVLAIESSLMCNIV